MDEKTALVTGVHAPITEHKSTLSDVSLHNTSGTTTTPHGEGGKQVQWSRYLGYTLFLGLGMFGIFLAFSATQALESSLNERLGEWAIGVLYVSFTICSIGAAPLVRRLGPRKSMVIGGIGYIGFMVANLYPRYHTLLPASALLGLGAALMWTGSTVYMTSAAHSHAAVVGKSPTQCLGLFSGVFYLMIQLCSSVGSVVGAVVLQKSSGGSHFLFILFIGISVVGVILLCFLRSPQGPTQVVIVAVDDVRTGLGADEALSDTSDSCTLHPISPYASIDSNTAHPPVSSSSGFTGTEGEGERERGQIWRRLLATVLLWRRPRMYWMIPITIYSGIALGFVTGQFTRLAIYYSLQAEYWIGYVIAVFYLVDTICSLLWGRLSDITGRPPIMLFGALIHALPLVYLAVTAGVQDDDKPRVYTDQALFVMAGLLGAGDAVWQTQLSASMGEYFEEKDREAAFSNFILWQSLGQAAVFFYGSALTLQYHAMAAGGLLVLSSAAYIYLRLRVFEGGVTGPGIAAGEERTVISRVEGEVDPVMRVVAAS